MSWSLTTPSSGTAVCMGQRRDESASEAEEAYLRIYTPYLFRRLHVTGPNLPIACNYLPAALPAALPRYCPPGLFITRACAAGHRHTSLLVPVGAELLRPSRPLTARRLVLALFNSSMAFFLCSFQASSHQRHNFFLVFRVLPRARLL